MRTLFVWSSVLLVGCGSGISPPDSSSAGSSKLTFEPSADTSAVSSVVRVHIPSANLAAGDVALFQGELSSYYLARAKSGELPAALSARQIPVVSWRATGELVVVPAQPLALGAYSLVASSGLIGEFTVATAAPRLNRLWPPASGHGELTQVVYCGDGSAALSLAPLTFQPGELSVTPLAGIDDSGVFADRCLHFSGSVQLGAGQVVSPPPMLGDYALDPAPFSGARKEPAQPADCASEQLAFGLGCASIEDDRALINGADSALFWVIHTDHGSVVEVAPASGSFVLRGLSPGASEHVWGSVYDESGATVTFDSVFAMNAARERPVLNEVLANPLGPEPQSEWIELVNDGAVSLDLAHFRLRDSGGSIALPAAALAPQEYALLTREDFAPSASDVPPAPGARLIRVPELGTAGLSNSGESLALLAADSTVVSLLPALAAKAGESLARRHTYSLDGDASAFTTGTPTPGAPND